MSVDIQPITGRIGATIRGVRVTDLTDEQFAGIKRIHTEPPNPAP